MALIGEASVKNLFVSVVCLFLLSACSDSSSCDLCGTWQLHEERTLADFYENNGKRLLEEQSYSVDEWVNDHSVCEYRPKVVRCFDSSKMAPEEVEWSPYELSGVGTDQATIQYHLVGAPNILPMPIRFYEDCYATGNDEAFHSHFCRLDE